MEWEKGVKEEGRGEIKMGGWEGRGVKESKENGAQSRKSLLILSQLSFPPVSPPSLFLLALPSPLMGHHFLLFTAMKTQSILMEAL